MTFEQQRRCMLRLCFNCGSRSHQAKDCPKVLESVPYTCQSCGCTIEISSNGASRATPQPVAAVNSARLRLASTPAAPVQKRRVTEQTDEGPRRKQPKVSARGGVALLVGGKHYAPLSWFLNQSNPPKKQCSLVKETCCRNAVELRGGDMKTLRRFAAALPAGPANDLLGTRSNIKSTWFEVEVKNDKGKKLEVRKTGQAIEQRMGQVLWLIDDLERYLGLPAPAAATK